MLISFESATAIIVFIGLVGYLIYRKVNEMWNTVTMAKAYHLKNTKLPTQAQVNHALENFKKSYQRKLKLQKMDNSEEEIDKDDPAYVDIMYQ